MIAAGLYILAFVSEIIRDTNLFKEGKTDRKGLDVLIYFTLPITWAIAYGIVESGSLFGIIEVIPVGCLGVAMRLWFDPFLNWNRGQGFWYYGNRGLWDPFMKELPKWVQLVIRIVGTLICIWIFIYWPVIMALIGLL